MGKKMKSAFMKYTLACTVFGLAVSCTTTESSQPQQAQEVQTETVEKEYSAVVPESSVQASEEKDDAEVLAETSLDGVDVATATNEADADSSEWNEDYQ